jgi:hypothetical protein
MIINMKFSNFVLSKSSSIIYTVVSMNLKFYLLHTVSCVSHVSLFDWNLCRLSRSCLMSVNPIAVMWYTVCTGLRVEINAYLSRQLSSKYFPSWIISSPQNRILYFKFSGFSGLLFSKVRQYRYLISVFF